MKRPAAAAKGRKRSRRGEEKGASIAEDDAAGFFLLDDDEKQRGQHHSDQEEADEEAQETAEQKRIRLARAYLDDLKAAARGGGAGDDDDDDAAAGDEELAERLRLEALDAAGRLQRKLAHRLLMPDQQQQQPAVDSSSQATARYGSGRFVRAHRLSPTAVALSGDGCVAFSVSKDGSILRWDVETMKRTQLVRPGSKAAAAAAAAEATGTNPDWVKRGPRQNATGSLLAAALSSDGKYLAVGGGDKAVHVFDAASGAHVARYPGHRDQITGLSFRPGTHTLNSASYDRTVKLWSLDDAAYVDTLFGHQAEVFAVAAARTERVVSAGHDHTCRYWKVPEESHLVFRSPSMAQHAVALLSGNEWVSGGCDGTLQIWNTLKKKPVSIIRGAHSGAAAAGSSVATSWQQHQQQAQQQQQPQQPPASGSWATAGADASSWVQALAVAPSSDLVASGAGDGLIRLWGVTPSKHGGAGGLRQVGCLPAAGFVNGLALDKSGTVCVAAVGQEPRLGRWGRIASARNGLLVHRWQLRDDGSDDEDA